MSSRVPPLGSLPEDILAWLQDTPPTWYRADSDNSAGASKPWSNRSALQILLLSSNELTSLDERVGQFEALTRLELHSNRLTSLPSTLSQLSQLTTLTLSRNEFTQVPSSILMLPHLTSLDLSHNQLEQLWPVQDTVLPALEKLDLSSNRLATNALRPMPRALKILDLSYNALREPVPLHILQGLSALEDLSLAHNDLPDSLFALDGTRQALPLLHTMDVRGTHVTSLSAIETAMASPHSVSVAEVKDKNRALPAIPASSSAALVQHQIVRLSARPSAQDVSEVRAALAATCTLAPLFLVSDVQVRTESHRRRRGGRGRGGEDRARHRDDHANENGVTPNAGSALANAKLSTKKKEALGQVPCKFFRNNGCSAGDACPFAHTLPGEGQPKAVCQWYIKGSCRFGHRCALAHIMPGQPMSMDRKNKRAAQQGASQAAKSSEEPRPSDDKAGENRTSPQQTSSSAMFIPSRPKISDESIVRPGSEGEASSLSQSASHSLSQSYTQSTWGRDAAGSVPRTYEPAGTPTATTAASAFGTSPFSQPGNHSLFFNPTSSEIRASTVPETDTPWGGRRKVEEPLTDSVHGEDFLPSSLSDLLTPAELERRTRYARDNMPSLSSSISSKPLNPISQSLPHPQSLPVSSFGVSPSTAQPGRMSYGGSFSLMNARTNGLGRRTSGANSVHASPFMPPILDSALHSPPNLSPPGTLSSSLGGERISMPFSSRLSSDDVRRRAPAAPGSSAFFTSQAPPPISPAILPAADVDVDEAIFELE